MFLLFYSLYLSMFTGTWVNQTYNDVIAQNKTVFNAIGTFLTSIFGDGNYTTFGNEIIEYLRFENATALILALITSIGIVVMAVKGVKKAFGIFFGKIR